MAKCEFTHFPVGPLVYILIFKTNSTDLLKSVKLQNFIVMAIPGYTVKNSHSRILKKILVCNGRRLICSQSPRPE